jgi:iron complex outermembrane receptor protein
VEASVTLQGGLLHSMLDGYGVQGSVSNTLSTIQVPGAGIGGYKASLQGLSGVVSNVTVFYEKYGFSARISERYRSAFRAESLGTHGGLNSIEVMSEGLTDAQLGYEFQSGPMKNLTIQLQGQNLGNTPERTRLVNSAAGGVTGVINSPEQYNLYGRVFLLGAIYKL